MPTNQLNYESPIDIVPGLPKDEDDWIHSHSGCFQKYINKKPILIQVIRLPEAKKDRRYWTWSIRFNLQGGQKIVISTPNLYRCSKQAKEASSIFYNKYIKRKEVIYNEIKRDDRTVQESSGSSS